LLDTFRGTCFALRIMMLSGIFVFDTILYDEER